MILPNEITNESQGVVDKASRNNKLADLLLNAVIVGVDTRKRDNGGATPEDLWSQLNYTAE